MKRLLLPILILSLINAGEQLDEQIVARIKVEAFQNSKIMETLSNLSDVYGNRLTGSPAYRESAQWCISQLAEWGIPAEMEAWGTLPNSWDYNYISVNMVKPDYVPIPAFPKAWSAGTDGKITGEPVFVRIDSPEDIENYRGTLEGKIVFNGDPREFTPHFTADAQRVSEDELLEQKAIITPNMKNIPGASWERYSSWLGKTDTVAQFFADEKIAALVEPSSRDHGVIRVTRISSDSKFTDFFPALVISNENYGRIYRLQENEYPVEISIDLQTEFFGETTGYNVIAEIPGTDRKLKDQVVMIGAHLDSWHAGTGATDNAGNVATIMEALRILKKLDIQPRRTIRIALWEGEEQGYYGSTGYVTSHFADPATMTLKPEHANFSVYLNLDGGTGKIRGITLQRNELARDFFEACFAPFEQYNPMAVSVDAVSYTDHIPFDWVGLPAFDFIQDLIEYRTRTHHTNMDVYEAVIEEDVKYNAAIIAVLLYQAANRDEMIPRLELPSRTE